MIGVTDPKASEQENSEVVEIPREWTGWMAVVSIETAIIEIGEVASKLVLGRDLIHFIYLPGHANLHLKKRIRDPIFAVQAEHPLWSMFLLLYSSVGFKTW